MRRPLFLQVSILWAIMEIGGMIPLFEFQSFAATAPSAIEKDLAIGNFSISQGTWTIDPQYVDANVIKIGDGINMDQWDQPKRIVAKDPLGIRTKLQSQSIQDPGSYKVTNTFRFFETKSADEEASVLSANFKASYGFASGSAAMDMARSERKTSTSVYALLESTGSTKTFDESYSSPTWTSNIPPWGERETDIKAATYRRQFLEDFGSHYVSAITYGFRLAIRGKITTSSTATQRKMKAAFQAAFASGSAEGGISAETKETLSSSELELVFCATSGGIFDKNGEPRQVTLTSLEEIIQLLDSINKGEIQAKGFPVSALVSSYWNLVPEYRYARALLGTNAEGFTAPAESFGVPAGTIIPWYPNSRYEEKIEKNSFSDKGKRLHAPDGWAICDGRDGTPDLRDRFIRGVADPDLMGPGKGTGTTGISKNTPRYRNGGTKAYQRQEKDAKDHPSVYGQDVLHHTHPFSPLPEYYGLVYIMKLPSN